MNLVADENIDIEIVRGLREAGYDILSIAEDFFGISDEDVLEIANKHNAILLTGDKRLHLCTYPDRPLFLVSHLNIFNIYSPKH